MLENPFKDAEEKLLFAKTLDKFFFAQKRNQSAFTNFFDPVRCEKFFSYLKKNSRDVMIVFFGGFENAERKIIGFNADEKNFPITPLVFSFNEKFSKPPNHRDYLGATLGLGIDRAKIGDIRVCETGAMMYVVSDIANFICENLTQVNRATVRVHAEFDEQSSEENHENELSFANETEKRINELSFAKETEKRITVASLRLDGVISSAFNISRGKSAALIESEKVFVNWKLAKKTQIISEGDTITIRGTGRAVIAAIEGSTKKDRIILRVKFPS